MEKKKFKMFYLFSVLLVFLVSFYPLYMGLRVISDMLSDGAILSENYPKYIIPYTPICFAVITGVAIMPVLMKSARRFAVAFASLISTGVFFVSELLLENKTIISLTGKTTLENWQMYMCYVPPETSQTRTWKPIDVLIGEYNPAFKIHFYLISVVIILSFLNCFYGFGQMVRTGDKHRKKALVIQAISSIIFLSLCILACFTAFYRTGELNVSSVSALLMSVFFIMLGLTAGIYTGSFFIGKKTGLSILIPSCTAWLVTVAMYIGEMILLSGNLYRFGSGFFFEGLGALVLAPIDILVTLLSGIICSALLYALNKKTQAKESIINKKEKLKGN